MKTNQEMIIQLESALHTLELNEVQVKVDMTARGHLVAVVTSPDFEGLIEAERQARVWQVVYEQIVKDEELDIDFIFTNTPDEEAELDRAEQQRLHP